MVIDTALLKAVTSATHPQNEESNNPLAKKYSTANRETKKAVQEALREKIELKDSAFFTKKCQILFAEIAAQEIPNEQWKELIPSIIKIHNQQTTQEEFKTILLQMSAYICIKLNKLDVAQEIFRQTQNIRAIRTLKSAKDESEAGAQLGMLALEVGIYDDAAELFVGCDRYDLLNNLYQAMGDWERALEVAEQNDRINLNNTYFRYGKHLLAKGDREEAFEFFEKAKISHIHIPRLLFSEPSTLQRYVDQSNNKKMLTWWGQYAESQSSLDAALQYYELADDHLGVVRILCMKGEIEQAKDRIEKCHVPAAVYHLARHYEATGRILEAINHYHKAKCLQHAIRLAKEHKFEDEIIQMALLGDNNTKRHLARWFQSHGNQEKAAHLYWKSGNIKKALELAFSSKCHGLIKEITLGLGEEADAGLLEQAAAFFVTNHQYDKAASLLFAAKQYEQALQLSISKGIYLTEDMLESAILPEDVNQKNSILLKMGDLASSQNQYALACKKYTQAGDRMKAIKALLKSGDTEKIIFFAGISGARNKEIYVVTANYLQTLDWLHNLEIRKAIVTFYTKAKAVDALAVFQQNVSKATIARQDTTVSEDGVDGIAFEQEEVEDLH